MLTGSRLAFAVLSAAACDGAVQVPVTIEILDEECATLAPRSDELLACGASVGIWLISLPSGGELAKSCILLPPGSTLEQIPTAAELAGVFEDLPQGVEVALEVAVYGPEAAGSCDRVDGLEQIPFYFGRSEPVTLSGEPAISVSLGCELAQPYVCSGPIAVSTSVVDLDSLASGASDALVVEFGTVERDYSPGVSLERDGGIWHGMVDGFALLGGIAAIGVSQDGPMMLSTDVDVDAMAVRAVAYTMSTARFATFQTVVGRNQGFLIGRVVDAADAPVAGATLAFQGDTGVLYPDDTFSSLSPSTGTASHGYFVSTGPIGCCDSFEVSSPAGTATSPPVVVVDSAITGMLLRVD